jgi:hypothetical protein
VLSDPLADTKDAAVAFARLADARLVVQQKSSAAEAVSTAATPVGG